MEKIMNLGVIGTGAISDVYLTNLSGMFAGVRVAAVCAAHLERARVKAEKYGVRACTPEEMLADPEIGMVVVLTPVDTHYEIIKTIS